MLYVEITQIINSSWYKDKLNKTTLTVTQNCWFKILSYITQICTKCVHKVNSIVKRML